MIGMYVSLDTRVYSILVMCAERFLVKLNQIKRMCNTMHIESKWTVCILSECDVT